MNNLTLLIFNLFLFLGLFLLSFYPAGLYLVEKIDSKLKSWEKLTLALISSVIVFVLLTILLGIINLRFLILPILIGVSIFSIIKLKRKLFTPWKDLFKEKILVALTLIAIFVQGIINFPSGYLYKDGLMFWSSQGNDGLWHVAVMEEVKKTMPLLNPIYSGENLYNYHYLSDVLMGEFGRIYPTLTSLDLYFRFFPIVLSFFMSLSVFSFVTRWRNSKNAGYWAIFFTSLSGGFGYIVTYIKSHQIFGGETIFWAAQGNTVIGNPPHAIAYSLVTACLLMTMIYLKERKPKYLILALITGAITAGFKVSGGFILACGIAIAAIADLIINRKAKLILFASALGLSNLIALKLMSKGATGFLVWEPWWFVRTTITAPGRVEWIDMELRRQHYVSKHTLKATLRVIQLELEAFLIFIIGNLGTRFIGFFIIFSKGFKKSGSFFTDIVNIMLLGSMLAGLIITLLFVQKGIAYNLIQFLQYFILIFGFFTAAFVSESLAKIKNKTIKISLAALLVIVSVPTVIGNFREFYGPRTTPLAKVSNSELTALDYLKKNTKVDEVVLTYPFDIYEWNNEPQPRPISAWFDTAYVSAISSRRTFLSNEGQVDILGIDFKKRHEDINKYFSGVDPEYSKNFLSTNNISYVYFYKNSRTKPIVPEDLSLTRFYENDEVIIYKTILGM